MKEMAEDGGLSEEEREELQKLRHQISAMASFLFTAKTQPITDFKSGLSTLPTLLDEISKVTENDVLNDCLTRLVLEETPHYVARLRKLQPFHIQNIPEDRRVKHYFEQASRCYLYGMYDAVAVLSRSLIQSALEEAFCTRKLSIPGGKEKNFLENLIDAAKRNWLIDQASSELAHRVRKIGNDAAHTDNTGEEKALEAIEKTRRVLIYIRHYLK